MKSSGETGSIIGTIIFILFFSWPLLVCIAPLIGAIFETIVGFFYCLFTGQKPMTPENSVGPIVYDPKATNQPALYQAMISCVVPTQKQVLEVSRMFENKETLEEVYKELAPHLTKIFGADYREKFPLQPRRQNDYMMVHTGWDQNSAWARMLLLARRGKTDCRVEPNSWVLSLTPEKRNWQIEFFREAEKILVVTMKDNFRFCYDPDFPADSNGRRYRICCNYVLKNYYYKKDICVCGDIDRMEYFDRRVVFPVLGSPAMYVYAKEGIDISKCTTESGTPATNFIKKENKPNLQGSMHLE